MAGFPLRPPQNPSLCKTQKRKENLKPTLWEYLLCRAAPQGISQDCGIGVKPSGPPIFDDRRETTG